MPNLLATDQLLSSAALNKVQNFFAQIETAGGRTLMGRKLPTGAQFILTIPTETNMKAVCDDFVAKMELVCENDFGPDAWVVVEP